MIIDEQNSERQLQRLAAQRQLYATAKTIFSWQLFLAGPVAVATAFLAIIEPTYKGYVAGWGIFVVLCDLFLLTPWQNRLRNSAAIIQEAFDCDVLELPWNTLKASNRPDPELVKEQSEKYKMWASKMPPLENWYSVAVADLPNYIGRVACQRSNCWWDAKQRRRYAAWIISSVAIIFAVVFVFALLNGLTIVNFVLKVIVPLSPAFLLGFRQFKEQTDAADRLDRLKEHAESVWDQALSGKAKDKVTASSRNLQDEIFENRRKSPLVFDFIFRWLRRDYEMQMNHSVADSVADAKMRLKLSQPTPKP